MNRIDKNDNNVTSSKRVQDMLQKFEAGSTPTNKPSPNAKLKAQLNRTNNNNNFSLNRKSRSIPSREEETKCQQLQKKSQDQSKVSVTQRSKLFESPSDSRSSTAYPSTKTYRSSINVQVSAPTDNKPSDLGPLPTGPPPSKPPRSKDSFKLKQHPTIHPVPTIRSKNTSLKITIDKSESERPASFLHGKYEHQSDEKSNEQKSPRMKSIKRPTAPPPRPPQPKISSSNKSIMISNSEQTVCVITPKLKEVCTQQQRSSDEKIYDEVPLSPDDHHLTVRSMRRSLSEENVYAIPSGIRKDSKPPPMLKANSLQKGEYAAPYEITPLRKKDTNEELHYMSSPLPGWDKKKLPQTPRSQRKMKAAIKDLAQQSFSALKNTFKKSDAHVDEESSDSESDVSVKDVQDRIIYVQSFRKKPTEKVIKKAEQPKLFEYFLVVDLEWITSANTYHPNVVSQFPEKVEFKPDKSLISRFCYPDLESWKPVSEYNSETYSFVLTDEKGSQTFAYCRRLLPSSKEPRTPIVHCLICSERDFSFYRKILNELEKRNANPSELNKLLGDMHEENLPKPGENLIINDEHNPLNIQRSPDAQMESVEFSHLLKALDVENLLKAFSSILLERRVLFSASTLGVLTHCVQAMAALLYPFNWQHTLVPVIPETMLDLCSMPTPYIMGVLSNCVQKVTSLPLDDVFIVDLDHSRTIREIGDENTIIPRKIQAALFTKLSLANNMTDPTSSSLTLNVSQAFVEMFVQLVGHFEDHICSNDDGVLRFERDSFCKAPYSRGTQSFLRWFCETQTFDIFIHNRLATCQKTAKNQDYDDGLFFRLAEEHRYENELLAQTFKGNVRGLGKKVKDFSDKIMKVF